jgi:hypothetical protein
MATPDPQQQQTAAHQGHRESKRAPLPWLVVGLSVLVVFVIAFTLKALI